MPLRTTLPAATPALLAARDAFVACDASPLALVAIDGPDAAAFLHGQLSSDVAGLAADACQYTSYNSPGGRVLANFVLWRGGEAPDAGFRALIPADIAPAIRKRLAMFVLRSKVTIADVSAEWARFGVGGPAGASTVRNALGAVPGEFGVARGAATTTLGLPGGRYYVVTPAAEAPRVGDALTGGATLGGFDVWQWLTVHAGIGIVTVPTQDKFVAQALNWDVLGGVSFKKGCYTGQEIIARTQYLGRLKERLSAWRAPAGQAAAGDRLYSPAFDQQPCGTVVNAATSPGGDVHLVAVVQHEAVASGELRLGTPDGPRLAPLPLPYAIPQPVEPRGRPARS